MKRRVTRVTRGPCGLAALAAAGLGGGCGATPPQAPAVEASRVASALAGIAEACGEAAQERALPRFGPPGTGAGEEAATRAQELAMVFVRNPHWIYQGANLRQVVALADARLQECGLTSAASALRAQTAAAR
jgi:hypothetical protein